MKSRLRQFLRSPLCPPVVHLAGSAGGYALRVLFLGGSKDPVLAGSDPTLPGSLPANFAALLLTCAQHDFMQVLPPPLRSPPTNNLLIPRRENRRAPHCALLAPDRL